MKKGEKMSEEQKRKISASCARRKPKPKGYRKPKRPQRIREKQPLPGEETVIRMDNGRYITSAGAEPFLEPEKVKARVKYQRHSDDAISRLVSLMYSKDDRVALGACNSVLDRAHGKAGLMKEDESETAVETREALTETLRELISGRTEKAIDITPEDAEIVLIEDNPNNESGE